jgi:hypothetical protein
MSAVRTSQGANGARSAGSAAAVAAGPGAQS